MPTTPFHLAFSFEALRRWPDAEAPNLQAYDASDRLLLDEAAVDLVEADPGTVVVIGDHYGAITLGAMAEHGVTGIRVQQDSLISERALDANAERLGAPTEFTHLPLGAELLAHARIVLLQLPKSLLALAEIAELVALHGDPSVKIMAAGRVKHMTPAMNQVLGESFENVRASLARQKSRALIASVPRPVKATFPRAITLSDVGPSGQVVELRSHGGVFAEGKLDIGTRFLIEHLDRVAPRATGPEHTIIDLGCGSGIIATLLASQRPQLKIIATDISEAAIASTRDTLSANGLRAELEGENARITVTREHALESVANRSVDAVVLNPPFHQGTTVTTHVSDPLFAGAGRVLVQGGELWTVYNSGLNYLPALQRLVGPTTTIAKNAKFTITRSVRR